MLFAAYFATSGVALALFLHYLPFSIAFGIFGHTIVLTARIAAVVAFAVSFVFGLPVVFLIECLCVGWRGSSLRALAFERPASGMSDLVMALLGGSRVSPWLTIVFTFGAGITAGKWLHAFLLETTGLTVSLGSLPMPLQIVGYGVVFTFFDYWGHRFEHSTLMWPLHRYHHAADELYIVTAVRVHPAQFGTILAMTIPLSFIDAPTVVIAAIQLAAGNIRWLIHSRIDSDLGWVGRYIVQSPVHHRTHHALDPAQAGSHFGLIPIWDHLFGTWKGTGSLATPIGVEDARYFHGLGVHVDLLRDYWDFLLGVRRRFAASS